MYQATDTNLKRAVAIKVLPESVAGRRKARQGGHLFQSGFVATLHVHVDESGNFDFHTH